MRRIYIIIYDKCISFFIRFLSAFVLIKSKRKNFRNKLFKAHVKYCYKKLSVTTLDKKILICRPHGGFNDILVVINKCYKYAKTYDRNLYIDTNRSGFLDGFDKYFNVSENEAEKIFLNTSHLLSITNVSKSDCEKLKIIANIPFDTQTVFDFSKDYNDQILVYEKDGGGDESIFVFEWLLLKEEVKKHIVNIIKPLGEYDAVHVRNSDYKTDYKKFFTQINDKLDKKIVLCTDSYECQEYAKRLWGGGGGNSI